MQSNWDAFFQRVIQYEGTTYTDIPGDAGGPTRFGVTIFDVAELNGVKLSPLERGSAKWNDLVGKVKALDIRTVNDCFKLKYWDKCRGDDLPSGLDVSVVDYGINSGIGRAVPTLAALLGAPKTTIVTDAMLQAIATYGPLPDLITHYQDTRKAFLEEIAEQPSKMKFRKGWLARESGVRRTALDLAAQTPATATALAPVRAPKAALVDDSVPSLPSKLAVAVTSKSAWYASTSGIVGLGAKIKFITGGIAIAFGQALQSAPQIVSDANENKQTFVDLGNTLGTPEVVGGVLTVASIAFLLVAIYRHIDLKQTALAQGVQTS